LQAMAGAFPPHVPAGQAVKLLIHDRRQLVESARIPVTPSQEELTHFDVRLL
jgi:hypothetical protein